MKLYAIAVCTAIALMVFPLGTSQAALNAGDVLILSENSLAGNGHGSDHGARGKRGKARDHAEHRAASERTWYLNLHDLHPNAEVMILRPDGTQAEGSLSHGKEGWTFVVDTKPLDGSLDGVFNLYVIDRAVAEGILTIRAPKANMINHSCGWGHKFKFDLERLKPGNNASIPLEIVADNLWDKNFHSKTMSGDRFVVRVLQSGKPAANATVSFTTGSGWTKTVEADEAGKASIQLIRDYYPETWSFFDARKQSAVLVTAIVETSGKGVYLGQAYARTRLVATLPWRCVPRRSEYTSYAYGLGIAALLAVASGAGIYAHRERRKKPCREVTFDERS